MEELIVMTILVCIAAGFSLVVFKLDPSDDD
jgi:hypothetical protein